MTAVTKSGSTTRRDHNKSAVRARIIAAGIDLFSGLGIDIVTVEQIAEAADVGKGTIYNYFRAKEDIIVAFMVDIERAVQAKLGRFTSSKAPLETILTDFIRLRFRLKAPHYKFVRVFLAQMFLRTEQFFPYMVEMQAIIDPPLEALFSSLRQREMIRRDFSLPELILTFKTIQLGLTAFWAVEGPPFRTTNQMIKREMTLFCAGLKASK